MRKKLSDGITEIGEQVGLDTVNITAHYERIKRYINDVREEIQEMPYKFRALETVFQIHANVQVTGGTVAMYSSSSTGGLEDNWMFREITGTNTVWNADTTASDTRHPYTNYSITFGSEPSTWKVDNVIDDTHIWLSGPYHGGYQGQSGISYRMYQRYYPLGTRINKIISAKDESTQSDIKIVTPQELSYYNNNSTVQGTPIRYAAIWSNWDVDYLYSTALTVSVTAGSLLASASTVLGGSNDANAIESITINSSSFGVARFMSRDTFLLSSPALVTSGTMSATAYAQQSDFIEFAPIPDSGQPITIYGYKKINPLHNASELMEEGWWPAIRAGAMVRGYEYLKRPVQEKMGLYQKALQALIRDQSSGAPGRIKPRIDSRYSGNF